jgi:hypothetical protein
VVDRVVALASLAVLEPPEAVPGPRRTVGSYATYAEAQRAVDRLSDREFPVERLAIIGSDLRIVEQVTGRLDYWRSALAGASSGAFTGGLFGLIFSLFLTDDAGVGVAGVVLYGILIGAGLGAVFGVFGYAMTGGQRDFSSVSGMQAARYDVVADEEVAEEARRLLTEVTEAAEGTRGAAPGAPSPPPG